MGQSQGSFLFAVAAALFTASPLHASKAAHVRFVSVGVSDAAVFPPSPVAGGPSSQRPPPPLPPPGRDSSCAQ